MLYLLGLEKFQIELAQSIQSIGETQMSVCPAYSLWKYAPLPLTNIHGDGGVNSLRIEMCAPGRNLLSIGKKHIQCLFVRSMSSIVELQD